MDEIQKTLLEQVAGLHEIPAGAFNIRANGQSIGRNSTANIEIAKKEDKDGIDIIIKIVYNCVIIRVEAHRTKSTLPQKAAQPLVSERGEMPKPSVRAADLVGRAD